MEVARLFLNRLGMRVDIYGLVLDIALITLPCHTVATERLPSWFELHWMEPKLIGHFMHGPEPKDLGLKDLRTKDPRL